MNVPHFLDQFGAERRYHVRAGESMARTVLNRLRSEFGVIDIEPGARDDDGRFYWLDGSMYKLIVSEQGLKTAKVVMVDYSHFTR